jgi:hypothetical protein
MGKGHDPKHLFLSRVKLRYTSESYGPLLERDLPGVSVDLPGVSVQSIEEWNHGVTSPLFSKIFQEDEDTL